MSGNRPEEAIAAAEYASASDGKVMRFPDKPFPHSMLLVFEAYDYKKLSTEYAKNLSGTQGDSGWGPTNRQSGIELRSTQSIELPFPKQLQDATGLIYNNMSQDPLIEASVRKMADFAQGQGNAAIGNISGILQGIGGSAAASSGIGGGFNAAGKAVAETGVTDAANAAMYLLRKTIPQAGSVNLALGQTLNPRETIAFEGVQLKSHTFNWDLFPSNAQDSARIQDIINQMKRSVLPVTRDLGAGDLAIKKAFLEFPNMCKIYLIGVDAQYFMKFKPAMVTNMTVDYGAGGNLAIMQGGRPAGVNISITLQELQIETANDFGAVSPTPMEGRSFEETNVDASLSGGASQFSNGTQNA